jgi:glycosyltransferase involved in cell wall biosynthesis
MLRKLWWLAWNVPREADAVVANYYLTAYAAALATVIRRAKGYYLIQDYEPGFFRSGSSRKAPSVQRALARASYHLPLHACTISTWLQGRLRAETGREAEVVNDGVDTSLFTPGPAGSRQEGVRTVLFVGTRHPRKGLDSLLQALELLERRGCGLKLLIATQDRQISSAGPLPIEVVHPSGDRELAECYRRADIYVLASRQEGFGLPPLEAMACGIPVVATDCGGISDYAQDGVNCLIVPVGDVEAMAGAIQRVLLDPGLAARLARAGRETACRFTWEAMVEKFERLLAGPARGSRDRH